jgi:hypothetical protein
MRIAEVEIISMLIPSLARVSNIVAATPGFDFIPAPIRLTRAMSSSVDTSAAPISSVSDAATAIDASKSLRGTVKEMSVTPWSDVFCTIMSTLTSRSASARNRRAAMPGRSGTPETVTLASDVSCVIAETMACSMDGSSSTTHVPGSHVKLERMCKATFHRRANSTDRIAGLGQPVAVISNSSSKETWRMRCALGTSRGSAVNTPDTSVYSSHASASNAWAMATAVTSEPLRPRNVTSRALDTPCAPPTTGTRPASSASRKRSGRTSRMRAFVCAVSVISPAWLPVNESACTPASCRAMHSRAMALRSPAVISMSISRPGRSFETRLAKCSSSSVSLPIALTTTTTSSPWRRVRAT